MIGVNMNYNQYTSMVSLSVKKQRVGCFKVSEVIL